MENPSVDKFSAVTRVVQKFTAACDEEKVSLIEGVGALVRLIGIKNLDSETLKLFSSAFGTPVGVSNTSPSVPQPPANTQLTKEQAEKARENARVEKARRLGVSPKEINLTPQEAKEAKAKYRSLLSGQQAPIPPTGSVPTGTAPKKATKVPAPQPTSSKEGKEETPQGGSPRPTFVEEGKKPVGVSPDPTGSRATAKTRIDSGRRSCLRTLPTAVFEPTVLHLVAYCNNWNRLSQQVRSYRSQYADSKMLDPLRGLPDPRGPEMPECKKLLDSVTSRLRTQPDHPGTFVLQTDNGGSFWIADRPSSVCPEELAASLPEAVMGEFERVVAQSMD